MTIANVQLHLEESFVLFSTEAETYVRFNEK